MSFSFNHLTSEVVRILPKGVLKYTKRIFAKQSIKYTRNCLFFVKIQKLNSWGFHTIPNVGPYDQINSMLFHSWNHVVPYDSMHENSISYGIRMLRWIREEFPAVFDCQVAWKIHQVLAAILSLELLQVSLSSCYDFKSKVVSLTIVSLTR